MAVFGAFWVFAFIARIQTGFSKRVSFGAPFLEWGREGGVGCGKSQHVCGVVRPQPLDSSLSSSQRSPVWSAAGAKGGREEGGGEGG